MFPPLPAFVGGVAVYFNILFYPSILDLICLPARTPLQNDIEASVKAHGEKVHTEHHSKHGDKIKSIVYGGEMKESCVWRRDPSTLP